MIYVRLAGNARRAHESVDGEVTVCGRRVPQRVEGFRPQGPLYPTSRRLFQQRSCARCARV